MAKEQKPNEPKKSKKPRRKNGASRQNAGRLIGSLAAGTAGGFLARMAFDRLAGMWSMSGTMTAVAKVAVALAALYFGARTKKPEMIAAGVGAASVLGVSAVDDVRSMGGSSAAAALPAASGVGAFHALPAMGGEFGRVSGEFGQIPSRVSGYARASALN